MIYEEVFKRTVAWLGLPAAVIISVVIILDFGISPVDTVAMKIEKAAETAADLLKDEHLQQARELVRQNEDIRDTTTRTLNALKEICFNTALNNDAKRRCGAL
jgi:hypothetical protein